MNCETILIRGRVAFKANQHRAFAIAKNGLCSAASIEGVGVDTHTYSEVHGGQGIVQSRYILHRLDGLEYLHALQGGRAELRKV